MYGDGIQPIVRRQTNSEPKLTVLIPLLELCFIVLFHSRAVCRGQDVFTKTQTFTVVG